MAIVHGGSSISTLIIRDPGNINSEQVKEIFAMENQAVLEELVEGIEITIPILDQTSLSPIEMVLEINTIPGLTNQSLYPKAAAVAGLTMPELIKKFVELIKHDYSI